MIKATAIHLTINILLMNLETISPIYKKQTINSHWKKNPVPGLRQAYKYGMVKRVNGILTIPLDNGICNCNTYINNKGNNKITELRTILQRESQNS